MVDDSARGLLVGRRMNETQDGGFDAKRVLAGRGDD